MKCIDISEFQTNIDWKAVKADGVEGVIIRAGYGQNNIDDGFHDHIKGAIDIGMHIGIYWFSYAWNDSMAEKEAEYCIKAIMPYSEHIDMPIFFDWEYDSMRFANQSGFYPKKAQISTMTRAFCEEVEREGFTAGYYLNLDYSQNYYNEEILEPYKRWFAYYTNEEQKDCYLWQCTASGDVSGISGGVDVDILWGSLTPYKKKAEDLPTDSNEGQEETQSESEGYYIVGDIYTVDVASALNVRTGPSTDYPTVGFRNLTADGKRHANSYGALLPGTRVTCLEVKEHNPSDIWIRIPSGWICAKSGENRYVIR